jgi:hypothetical protein
MAITPEFETVYREVKRIFRQSDIFNKTMADQKRVGYRPK